MRIFCKALAAIFFAVFCHHVAAASVIDFNTLNGSDGDAFSSYTENGFTVTAHSGDFFKWFTAYSNAYGNPVPSIIASDNYKGAPDVDNGSIIITKAGGGTFTFDSFDLDSSNLYVSFNATGLLGNSKVYDVSGQTTYDCATNVYVTPFCTENSGETSQLVSSILISFTEDNDTLNLGTYSIDNIVLDSTPVNAVPEPYGILIFSFGLIVFIVRQGGWRRQYRYRNI